MPPRNRHPYQPIISDTLAEGEDLSMVSEQGFADDQGGEGDDLTPKAEPRGSVSFDAGWDSKKEVDQEKTLGEGSTSQREGQSDFRFRAIDERTALRT